jgi:hypothetical protein
LRSKRNEIVRCRSVELVLDQGTLRSYSILSLEQNVNAPARRCLKLQVEHVEAPSCFWISEPNKVQGSVTHLSSTEIFRCHVAGTDLGPRRIDYEEVKMKTVDFVLMFLY